MKFLKNCVKLSCSVKIYVPSTINVTENFDSSLWVDTALKFLSEKFGGATSSKAMGAWLTQTGFLIKEDVTLVFSFVEQQKLEDEIQSLYDFCVNMKKELKQEAIALEVNNELYLV